MQRHGLLAEPETLTGLRQLERHPGTTRVPVPALSEETQEHLLADLLGLERLLAQKVAASSKGNPLFAIQLMGDWIRRGVLEPGPWGFRLAEGEDAAMSVPAWEEGGRDEPTPPCEAPSRVSACDTGNEFSFSVFF